MVSRKRFPYLQDIEESSASDASDDREYISRGKHLKFSTKLNDFDLSKSTFRSGSDTDCTENDKLKRGKPKKCYSRNALLARENRLKKKMYIEGLEKQNGKLKHENKTLKSILDSQTQLIAKLQKDVRYMKSVLANSSDLTKLLKTINYSTGMSVTTSLDKTLTLKNNYVSKSKSECSSKHPWEENCDISTMSACSSPLLAGSEFDVLLDSNGLTNILDDDMSYYTQTEPIVTYETHPICPEFTMREHNYTASLDCNDNGEDVGVCLHVSKQKVSLEFCSTCSEKAQQTWSGVE